MNTRTEVIQLMSATCFRHLHNGMMCAAALKRKSDRIGSFVCPDNGVALFNSNAAMVHFISDEDLIEWHQRLRKLASQNKSLSDWKRNFLLAAKIRDGDEAFRFYENLLKHMNSEA